MKTEDILNIDCRQEKGKQTVNKFLWKIKPIAKLGVPKGRELSVEDLEKVLHGISTKYGYETQGFVPYYEEHKKFIFYQSSVTKIENKERHWVGTVYGVTLWEVVAKTIIKIYSEIMKERKHEQ